MIYIGEASSNGKNQDEGGLKSLAYNQMRNQLAVGDE
jgi:hypothetical protein